MGDIFKDSRFAKLLNDPRYRQIPKHERKVKIDKRFQSMFSDEKFKVKYTVDKRGRPINETSTENLRKYYEIEDSEKSGSGEESEAGEEKLEKDDHSEVTTGRFVRRPLTVEESEPANLSNDKLVRGKLDPKTKERLLDLDIDYARGEGVLHTDSSSDDESSDEEDSELEHEWGELDADAGTTEESTKRIAVCNLDWDNIKAADIMVLLNSFVPAGGLILKITVYPSEFGLKRMQEEEVRGPIELTDKNIDDASHDGGNEEGSSYHMEKLRRYQLNRLRYWYGVVECDSPGTADHLYRECDGLEYEASACRLDLRFIPDDVTFHQEPREVCTSLPELARYRPRVFTTTALRQARVLLTWDVTDGARTAALGGAWGDGEDLANYLASSSESEDDEKPNAELADSNSEDEHADPITKYKMLLQDIDNKEDKKNNKDMEMEITWGIGIKDKATELVNKKLNEDKKELTPFEQLMQKKREKKRQRKLQKKQKCEEKAPSNSDESDAPSDVDMTDPYFAEEFNKPEFRKVKNKKISDDEDSNREDDEKRKAELELLLEDDDDGKAHFSLKKIQESEGTSKKSKRKKKLKEKMMEQKQSVPDFEINTKDERFAALYNSHLYNIDPSDPNFKKTKNMDKLIQEKVKRRPLESDSPVHKPAAAKRSKQETELHLLVKNIKRKTKGVNQK